MKLHLRRTNTESLNITNSKDFSLPWVIETYLKKSFESDEPLNEIVYFDIVESLGIITAYIDLKQFKGLSKNMSRYITFKCGYSEFEIQNKTFESFNELCTFYGSNIIDNAAVKTHADYFKIDLNKY